MKTEYLPDEDSKDEIFILSDSLKAQEKKGRLDK